MPDMTLDVADATGLAELLGFVSDWLASDRDALEGSLRGFVGVGGYDAESLRPDLGRFVFLLRGSDGGPLFGSDGFG
jgi:hypothetical protein